MSNNTDHWKDIKVGMLAGLRSGAISVPMLFLTAYAKLDLTEAEAMLILHLIAFQERERKEFPTPAELADRMSLTEEKVADTLQKLVKEGFVGIDEETDALSGIRFERYHLSGLWEQLAMVWVMEANQTASAQSLGIAAHSPAVNSGGTVSARESSIYGVFEREFARPLTPMEMETITGWLDQDRYPLDLIHLALKEAVFAGKIHFRYIDRILLDWKRNKVYSVEQAKEHTQRFRGEVKG